MTGNNQANRDANILVVEDDWVSRSFIIDALQDLGTVVPVSSAEEAKEKIEATPELYDLVLSDIVMGGASGLELLRWLRHVKGIESIPFLVYTAHSDPTLEEVAYQDGATDYMVKPLTVKRLRLRVNATLRLKMAHIQSKTAEDSEALLPTLIRTELSRADAGAYYVSVAKITLTAPESDRLPDIRMAFDVVYGSWKRQRPHKFIPILRARNYSFWAVAIGEDVAHLKELAAHMTAWFESFADDPRVPTGLQFSVGEVIRGAVSSTGLADEYVTETREMVERVETNVHHALDQRTGMVTWVDEIYEQDVNKS